MMHKTCSINYGHLADLQKHFLQLILTKKKTFHLIKYLLATLIFFPFFSICTCIILWLSDINTEHKILVSHFWRPISMCEWYMQFIAEGKIDWTRDDWPGIVITIIASGLNNSVCSIYLGKHEIAWGQQKSQSRVSWKATWKLITFLYIFICIHYLFDVCPR